MGLWNTPPAGTSLSERDSIRIKGILGVVLGIVIVIGAQIGWFDKWNLGRLVPALIGAICVVYYGISMVVKLKRLKEREKAEEELKKQQEEELQAQQAKKKKKK